LSITYLASGSILNYNFGATAYTAPTNYYVGLSTTHISNSGSNATPPVGYGYARVVITNDKATTFGLASSGCLVNKAVITFPVSSGSWGTILDVYLADSASSVWYFQALATPTVVQSGTTISFAASAIAISMTN